MTERTIELFVEEFFRNHLKRNIPKTKQTFIILMTFGV